MPPKMARPLTGKERKKKWHERQKANLEFHQRYLQAERERYAPAIWAHLKPVLDGMLKDRPEIDTLYFISDGPTTQYRCKTNFYLLSTLPFEWGYKIVNWSFLEAGHGKGATDGIGGTLKRTADRIVAEGKDLTDAQSVYTCLSKNTTVRLFLVTEKDVAPIDVYVRPILLKPIRGTMTFHQLVSVHKHQVICRRLSCFCMEDKLCDCYNKFPERPVEGILQTENGIPTDRSATGTVNKHDNASSSAVLVQDVPQDQSATNSPEIVQDAPQDQSATTSNDLTAPVQDVPQDHKSHSGKQSILQPVYVFKEELVGKYCIVRYDKQAYPGIIEDADEESVWVNTMHKVGQNRFFWPGRKDNDIWYEYTDIITLIPQLQRATSRHYEVEPKMWEAVQKQEDDDEWDRS